MARYFMQYWGNFWWNRRSEELEGERLNHTACNQFRKHQVRHGDFVYVITVLKGALHLGGRIRVDRICTQREAARYLGTKPEDLWEADDHIVAPDKWGTFIRLNRRMPLRVTKRIQLILKKGICPPAFESTGVLDRQALRGVKEITRESAQLFDRAIGAA